MVRQENTMYRVVSSKDKFLSALVPLWKWYFYLLVGT